MSLHPSAAADRRASRRNRMTIWPAAYDEDMQLDAPWAGRFVHNAPSKRWTGAFDVEARAHRMSFLVGDTLLPAARSNQQQWPGQRNAGGRTTWIEGAPQPNNGRLWAGHFDVENRASWIDRNSDRWSEEFDFEKDKQKNKEPLTQKQLAQANSVLVSENVLNYDFPGYGTREYPYLVGWIENDPANPMLFSKFKRWASALILCFSVFMVSVASSGFSQGTADIKTEFNVGQIVALLMTSLFVLGFAFGALLLSPLSEVLGRRDLYIWTYAAFVICSAVIGLAESMTVILVLRLLGGVAGSYTQATGPAIIADMFQAQERGLALSIFTLSGLMGQMLGPIACGFLDASYGWRSLAVFLGAVTLPTWVILILTYPETYAPTLLQQRAEKLAKITGKTYVVDGMQNAKTLATQLRVGALRPWVILIYEPIVTLLSLFLSVVHGTLFLLFAAYPIVFQQVHGWPQGIASLPFLAIVLGILLGLVYVAVIDQKRYARIVEKNNGTAPPEARLPPAMLGAAALPIGLFWFAWTNDPSVFWLVCVSAGVLFGFGMVLLYMAITNYIVDAYLGYAASALAASTVLRSIAGAAFPLFTNQMYDALGIHWASSIPGFLALIFVPCLVIFYKYGPVLRSKTRFGQEASKLAEIMEGQDGK